MLFLIDYFKKNFLKGNIFYDYEFYKSNSINYELGIILLVSVIIGSYLGSKTVVGSGFKFSIKQIKYITAGLGLCIFILFLNSAYYEKN